MSRYHELELDALIESIIVLERNPATGNLYELTKKSHRIIDRIKNRQRGEVGQCPKS